MRVSASVKILNRTMNDLDRIESSIIKNGLNISEALSLKKQIMDKIPTKAPSWVRDTANGYWRRIWREFERLTFFGYVYEGEVYFVCHKCPEGRSNTEKLASIIGWEKIGYLKSASFWVMGESLKVWSELK